MVSKYKLNDLAKNLNVTVADINAVLGGDVVRKPNTVLTEEELNLVFEHFTQANAVESFNDYFASADEPDEKPAEKAAEAKKEEKKPAEKKAPAKPAPKQEEKKPAQKPAAAKQEKKQPEKPAAQTKPAQPAKQPAKPVEKKEKPAEKKPAEQVVRRVDTRTVEVNLDKYNEHYDQLAPQQNKRSDSFQRKQKINQKSQQRAKQKYSTKRETEAQKLQRLALERARKQQLKVLIPDEIVVSELASRLKATVTDVIKKLMGLGVMAAQNQVIDFDTASIVAEEMGAKVEKEVVVTIEERLIDDSEDNADELVSRSPVVVVMGHVDHGKTSLLDRIRHASVTATEAGGITQHIGAYTVEADGKQITFLDTPGHEAFTAMRARGAAVTDIVILVVAADDGIMPQTVEAINHAKAANVQIIVAINKIDKPHANPDKVMQELTEYNLVPEQWGGDTICCPVSAVTGEGIDNLLEMVNLVAEVADLKANPNRLAKGTVVEARLDKGRGPVATLLVQNGTLHSGDVIIAGMTVGHVRVMTNDKGAVVNEAGPSTPVEITGLAEVPAAGDIFNAVEDERLARELVEQRKFDQKEEQFKQYQKVTLDNLFSQIAEGEVKELPLIVKADVQGSAEAVKQSLEKLTNDEVRVRVIHNGVGAVNKSDVMLAQASGAIIIGFNVRMDQAVRDSIEQDDVEIRLYRIIYDAIDDVKQAMKGMLAPKTREVELGRAEVRAVYKISNVGTVAGAYVIEGKVARNALIRVVRDGIVLAEDKIDSLKRFKDDAKEVAQGYECGIGLEKFNDIKEGDIFESFIIEEYRD
ncbi:translation initiation factor IF-2 [Phocea massiliensis]|uniref:Translation initiation factor IF-2 n=1 Tax=Merdimmobilis hominis TaxID=2897707 RepID=A0A938X2E8_9FIRM|nr:translation initiation factor IF-2 [Merdimmobilis hominis]MBM6919562.1 translation initiation factor IF-2 [Merdimmobilis hominis]